MGGTDTRTIMSSHKHTRRMVVPVKRDENENGAGQARRARNGDGSDNGRTDHQRRQVPESKHPQAQTHRVERATDTRTSSQGQAAFQAKPERGRRAGQDPCRRGMPTVHRSAQSIRQIGMQTEREESGKEEAIGEGFGLES